MTQMFPATMLMLPLYVLMKNLHLLDTFSGLVVAYTATALPPSACGPCAATTTRSPTSSSRPR